jgi:hypothetical protein
VKEGVVKTRLGHALQEHGGDDLIGIDGAAVQGGADTGYGGELLHGLRLAFVGTQV